MASLQRRVALLMDAIEDDYQAAIIQGVAHVSTPRLAAKQHDSDANLTRKLQLLGSHACSSCRY